MADFAERIPPVVDGGTVDEMSELLIMPHGAPWVPYKAPEVVVVNGAGSDESSIADAHGS